MERIELVKHRLIPISSPRQDAHGKRATSRLRLRVVCATALPTALAMGLLGGAPAVADQAGDLARGNRSSAVGYWLGGGNGIKEAAEKALLGTDEDVANFLQGAENVRRIDDRVDVARVINAGGPAVREAAKVALKAGDPAVVEAFLREGWKAPQQQDQRVEVAKLINDGGNGVKDAGKAALQGTPADIVKFLSVGQYKARQSDDRVATAQVFNSGGSAVKAAAKIALKGSPSDIIEFLEVGQYVARNRDQEYSTVAQLAKQATLAGNRADKEADAAVEAKEKAVAASALAKEAAQLAARETQAAKSDAAKAARMAKMAADAAKGAAAASQQAIEAANAANRSSRVAAMASAQAANAANAAANAAVRALNSAALAAGDATKADDARKMAEEAEQAARAADSADLATKQAEKASKKAEDAARASLSASSNATDAADAADAANGFAEAAGVHSATAKAAAAETRRHANEASRAANAAIALASKSAKAAAQAGAAARSAATHARNAAAAARAAADHAGDATTAAAQADKHAAAAKTAADSATTAVAIAKSVFSLARDTETEDLATRTAAGMEDAKSRKTANDEFVGLAAEVLVEAKAIETDIATLADQAAKPDADTKKLANKGRAVAFRVLKRGFGVWRQAAATEALTASDNGVLEYLRYGWKKGEQDETRQQVTDLSAQSPFEAVRSGAIAALSGTAQQVRDFYTTGQYQVANADWRISIAKINNDGGPSVKEASKAALADGSPQAMRAFLSSGQYKARNTDERVIAAQLFNEGGPELKAAAKIALVGPIDQLHDFVQTGQHMADRKDQLATTHTAQVQRLINEADVIAAKAHQNRWLAAKAAAEAHKASAEAQNAAHQASLSSTAADGYAAEARKSADNAAASSSRANKSAATARSAASRADSEAAAAEEYAVKAEISAQYARNSASEAKDSADEARESALKAGKSAAEAAVLADKAWMEVIKKRQREIAEALRASFEDRKAIEFDTRPEKLPCVDFINRDQPPSCFNDVGPDGRYYYVPPHMDAELSKLIFNAFGEVLGINDVIECVKNPSLGGCALALASVTPLGKIKLLKYLDDAVEGVIDRTRFKKWLEGGGKTCKCFLAGTKVLMGDSSSKSIESVKVGEQVIATDPVSGKTGRRAVSGLISTESDKLFNEITLITGRGSERINATRGHPFWSPSLNSWIGAGDLTPGTTLHSVDRSTVTVQKNRPFSTHARTYNLTVKGLHTYYVLAGKTSVLVHNSECPTYSNVAPSGQGIVATLDEDGLISLAVSTGPDTPRGGEMFTAALTHFGARVKGVKAYWQNGGTMSDNLNSFNAALRNGESLEEAARSFTFTGKMSNRSGFKGSVEFVELRGMHGHYTNVGVVFR